VTASSPQPSPPEEEREKTIWFMVPMHARSERRLSMNRRQEHPLAARGHSPQQRAKGGRVWQLQRSGPSGRCCGQECPRAKGLSVHGANACAQRKPHATTLARPAEPSQFTSSNALALVVHGQAPRPGRGRLRRPPAERQWRAAGLCATTAPARWRCRCSSRCR
jgi:hypothetical protein